jgi:hypothetical protein
MLALADADQAPPIGSGAHVIPGAPISQELTSFLPLKPDSVSRPEMYLGTKLKRKTFEDGTSAWGLSPAEYAQLTVKDAHHNYVYDCLGGSPRERFLPFFVLLCLVCRLCDVSLEIFWHNSATNRSYKDKYILACCC